jgi:DNA-binding NarL/FixJ family response regulator
MSSNPSADVAPLSDPGLIAGLYDAATGPAGWSAAGEAIRQAFGAETSVVYRQADSHQPPLMLAANQRAPEALRPALPEALRPALPEALRPGLFEALRPALFDDFAVTDGGGAFHTLCATIRLGGEDFARVGLHRPIDGTPFTEADRKALEALTLHIAGALRLHDMVQATLQEERHASLVRGAALDRSRHGMVIVTAGGAVVFANGAAQRLARHGWISLSPAGLGCGDRVEAARLAALIRAAAQGAAGGCARISRGPKQPILAATVAPLPLGPAADGDLTPGRQALALVTLRDLGATSDAGQAQLMALFGLTAAEAAIVPQLLAGDSMPMIAQTRGVSPATVRDQAARLLAKTGAANLRALASMIAVLGSE